MTSKESLISKLDNQLECWQGSITPDNKTFVEGVIYGIQIARASIEGAYKREGD